MAALQTRSLPLLSCPVRMQVALKRNLLAAIEALDIGRSNEKIIRVDFELYIYRIKRHGAWL